MSWQDSVIPSGLLNGKVNLFKSGTSPIIDIPKVNIPEESAPSWLIDSNFNLVNWELLLDLSEGSSVKASEFSMTVVGILIFWVVVGSYVFSLVVSSLGSGSCSSFLSDCFSFSF